MTTLLKNRDPRWLLAAITVSTLIEASPRSVWAQDVGVGSLDQNVNMILSVPTRSELQEPAPNPPTSSGQILPDRGPQNRLPENEPSARPLMAPTLVDQFFYRSKILDSDQTTAVSSPSGPSPLSIATGVGPASSSSKEMLPPPKAKPDDDKLTLGLEYDFRRKQDRLGPEFLTYTNEIHPRLTWRVFNRTNLLFEYFRGWQRGANRDGGALNGELNGAAINLQQTLKDRILVFDLNYTYMYATARTRKDENAATSKTGTNSHTLRPFLILSTPPIYNRIRLTLTPAYNQMWTDKHYQNPQSPTGIGSNSQFRLAGQLYYTISNSLTVSTSATWIRYLNFYSSDNSSRPTTNGAALSCGAQYKIGKGTLSLAYQYDGFSQNSYQHSITASGSYAF